MKRRRINLLISRRRRQPRPSTRRNWKEITPLLLLLVGIAAIWAASGILLADYPDRGTFGDMFGAVNALFSGLAFASLVYTILLQRRELSLQRRELMLTRLEFSEQRRQLVIQNKVLDSQTNLQRVQKFEATFFQLLSLFNSIVASMEINNADKRRTIRGKECFHVLFEEFEQIYTDIRQANIEAPPLSVARYAYAKFMLKRQSDLDKYFRTLYNILKFMYSGEAVSSRVYSGLLRAQLSDDEVLLVFYGSISEVGEEKLKSLVDFHGIVKSAPKHRIMDSSDMEQFYITFVRRYN